MAHFTCLLNENVKWFSFAREISLFLLNKITSQHAIVAIVYILIVMTWTVYIFLLFRIIINSKLDFFLSKFLFQKQGKT